MESIRIIYIAIIVAVVVAIMITMKVDKANKGANLKPLYLSLIGIAAIPIATLILG